MFKTVSSILLISLPTYAAWDKDNRYLIDADTNHILAPLAHDVENENYPYPIYTLDGYDFATIDNNRLSARFKNELYYGKRECLGLSRTYLSNFTHTIRTPVIIAPVIESYKEEVNLLQIKNFRSSDYWYQSKYVTATGKCINELGYIVNSFESRIYPFSQFSETLEYDAANDRIKFIGTDNVATSNISTNEMPYPITELQSLDIRLNEDGTVSYFYSDTHKTIDVRDITITKPEIGVYNIDLNKVFDEGQNYKETFVTCSDNTPNQALSGLYNTTCYQTTSPTVKVVVRDNLNDLTDAPISVTIKW